VFPFQNVFVDIGDDQSIENDLSTFSSHLISLRHILEEADESSWYSLMKLAQERIHLREVH